MKREELEALRANVSCEAILEQASYKIDMRESTRRAVKYRRGAELVIVTHEGSGWFNPLGDEKGDVFRLVMFLDETSFPEAIRRVASLVDFELSRPEWTKPRRGASSGNLHDRWIVRRVPEPGTGAWRYLCRARSIPEHVVRNAIHQSLLKEGPLGSIWAAHSNCDGKVVGWEERGPEWRGFATGGSKILFRLGSPTATRICVTEAAIDAMSLAAIESLRDDTLYLSTGGGWSPATDAALLTLAERTGTQIVAATDANPQGEIYADRLRAIAGIVGSDWQRRRPPAEDWNEVLQTREREDREKREEGVEGRAACAPAASREALPGERRPLTRADTKAAGRKGS
jgi:hypothetical protein